MILTGLARLGRDSEVRFTQGGDAVASLALAFNYGKRAENKSQWVDATLWGDRAEKLKDYLKKGTQLSVILSDPHIETYQKKDGTEGIALRATVQHIEFAGKREDNAEVAPSQAAAPAKQAASAPAPSADFDDDIPF